MTNTNKLKAMIIERGTTANDLAKKIGMTSRTFSLKLNNKREFVLSEVAKIQQALNLSPEERDSIFFGKCVD